MTLERLQPAVRIVARRGERFGVVADDRGAIAEHGRPGRAASLALVVAVVFELHRVVAVHVPVTVDAVP